MIIRYNCLWLLFYKCIFVITSKTVIVWGGHHDRMSVAYNENFIIGGIIISTINFLILGIWKCPTKSTDFSPAVSL